MEKKKENSFLLYISAALFLASLDDKERMTCSKVFWLAGI